jgi:predicted HicB family RNase H-like nuclease
MESMKINLRLPPEVHAALKQQAHQGWRSLNSEILRRLIASLEAETAGAVRP